MINRIIKFPSAQGMDSITKATPAVEVNSSMSQAVGTDCVLIVDDDPHSLHFLSNLVERSGLRPSQAVSASEARQKLAGESYDLILCDLRMPGESGIDLLSFVREEKPDIPLIMVTAVDDPNVAESVMQQGAYGYITKPFKIVEMKINIENVLRRQKTEKERRIYQKELETAVEKRTSELTDALGKLNKTLVGVIEAMAMTVESRDSFTAGHQRRVASIAMEIGRIMNLPESKIDGLYMGGMIHDLGMISIPSEIISKSGPLSNLEFRVIQTHPDVGFNILKEIEFPEPIAEMIYQHHERMDGSGYPNGLKDKEIIPEARILAVSDVAEAMISHRPYRPALGTDAALEEIQLKAPGKYDPDVVSACVELFNNRQFKL